MWGDAYGIGANSTTPPSYFTHNSYLAAEHQIPIDHTYSAAYFPHSQQYGVLSRLGAAAQWPPARDHPFFYIGIYAAITLGSTFVNITGHITQYTGALRASRLLFKRLLETVVRATMRWHDTTPQGQSWIGTLAYLIH